MPSSRSAIFSRIVQSVWLTAAVSLGLGLLVALVKGYLLLHLLTIARIGVLETEALDLGVTAAAVAVIVGGLLTIVRRRRNTLIEQLQRVTELNHHVRNDLQVIVYQMAIPQDRSEAVQRIRDAVSHIDKTLRALFPMPTDDPDVHEAKSVFLKKHVQRERRQEPERRRADRTS